MKQFQTIRFLGMWSFGLEVGSRTDAGGMRELHAWMGREQVEGGAG